MLTAHHAESDRCVRGRSSNFFGHFLLIGIATLILLILPIKTSYAETQIPSPAFISTNSSPSHSALTLSRLAEINESLQDLNLRIETTRTRLQGLDTVLNGEEYAQLLQRLPQLEAQRQNLKNLFENIATGGIDKSAFAEPETKAEFDWQNELLSVARPLLAELTKLTERPRMLENLRQKKAALGKKIEITRQALAHLRQNEKKQTEEIDASTVAQLTNLIEDWEQLQADFERQNHLLEIQISSQTGQEEPLYAQSKRILKEFLIGRGLVLLIAIAALFLSVLIIQGTLNLIFEYKSKGETPQFKSQKRFFILFFRTVGWVFSIALFLMILYLAGDVVLFSLIIVILALLLLASRNYLPRYFEEAKLFLNIGQVRENERLIYRGLPWNVKSIGFKILLENEALTNGVLRLPMFAVKGLVSRPVALGSEEWFPTSPGDYVLLNDQTFGRVEKQTPEFVTLRVLGSTTTYRTLVFLSAKPKNLTRNGFILNIMVGIDLAHRYKNMAEIAELLHNAVSRELNESIWAAQTQGMTVEFHSTTRSSLDFQILVSVNGEAASAYFKLHRMIQTACIIACNQQNWIIPIKQHKVHLSNSETSA